MDPTVPPTPKPGSPEFLAQLERLKQETEAQTGIRVDGFLDATGYDWRQVLRRQDRQRRRRPKA